MALLYCYESYDKIWEIRKMAEENKEAFNFAMGICEPEIKKCYDNEEKLREVKQSIKEKIPLKIDDTIYDCGYLGDDTDFREGNDNAVAENMVISAVINAVMDILNKDRPDILEYDYKVANKNSTFSVKFDDEPYEEMSVHCFIESILRDNDFNEEKDMNKMIPLGKTEIRGELAYYLLSTVCKQGQNACAEAVRDDIAKVATEIKEEHNKRREFLYWEDAFPRDLTEAMEKVLTQMETDPFSENTILRLSRLDTNDYKITIEGILLQPIGLNVECIDDKGEFAYLRAKDCQVSFNVENIRNCIRYTSKKEEYYDFTYIKSMRLTKAAKTERLVLSIEKKNQDYKPGTNTHYWITVPYEPKLKLTAASNKEIISRALLYIYNIVKQSSSDSVIIKKMKEFEEYSESDWMRVLKQKGIEF